MVDCNSSAKDRIDYLRSDKWIGYPKANEIIKALRELLHHPKVIRMPNLLITGSTNNGKTMIIERFIRDFPAEDNTEEETAIVPIVYIQAPPTPDVNEFYNQILRSLFALFRPKDHKSKKQIQVLNLLDRLNTRMLIIDEIQHILAGHTEKQRNFLNVIKFIGNELKIPIVALGTKDALRAIHTDPQLANRFDIVKLDTWELSNDYRRLLVSFESILPLKKKSNLGNKDIAIKIRSMTDGLIGEIKRLIEKAAIMAIEGGEEKITIDLLNKLSWRSPSERRRLIETI